MPINAAVSYVIEDAKGAQSRIRLYTVVDDKLALGGLAYHFGVRVTYRLDRIIGGRIRSATVSFAGTDEVWPMKQLALPGSDVEELGIFRYNVGSISIPTFRQSYVGAGGLITTSDERVADFLAIIAGHGISATNAVPSTNVDSRFTLAEPVLRSADFKYRAR